MPNQTTRSRAYPTLIEWRKAHGLSQHAAAALLQISQTSYARFERGDRFVKGELAQRIMDRTGVPLEVLTGVSITRRPLWKANGRQAGASL